MVQTTSVPRSRSCDRRFYGVCEGLVHDVDDPEKLGRVRVSFPWFDGDTIVEWCRVMQFHAGGGYGAFFLPEVGDEVVIGFVHGDMRVPIVLGGLYNGQDKPSTHRDADRKNEKLIRTKGGHQILLNDSTDAKQVHVTTAGGHEIDLNDQNKQVLVATQGGHKVTLDDNAGTLSIETPSGQSVVLDGSTVKIKAASEIVLDAAQVKVGSAMASQAAILGDLFLQLFNAHFHVSPFFGLPTSPPSVPLPPAVLAQKAKVI
jgi:uncharacterized protein involved in type VI secretion and phage assembly